MELAEAGLRRGMPLHVVVTVHESCTSMSEMHSNRILCLCWDTTSLEFFNKSSRAPGLWGQSLKMEIHYSIVRF